MSAGSARLNHAIKTLRDHWEVTREKWEDKVAQDFEKNHLVPLEQQTEPALRGMEKLNEVLRRSARTARDSLARLRSGPATGRNPHPEQLEPRVCYHV